MYTLEEIEEAVAAIYNDCGPNAHTSEEIAPVLASTAELLLQMKTAEMSTVDKKTLPESLVKMIEYYLAIAREENA